MGSIKEDLLKKVTPQKRPENNSRRPQQEFFWGNNTLGKSDEKYISLDKGMCLLICTFYPFTGEFKIQLHHSLAVRLRTSAL